MEQRDLYQTPQYSLYKKQKQYKQYAERLKDVTKICPTCKYEFHPRKVRPNMKYCSRHCWSIRKKIS